MPLLLLILTLPLITLAQPYEPTFLYDEIGEIGQGIGAAMITPIGDQDNDGFDDILYTVQDVEGGEQLWTNHLRIAYGGSSIPYRTLDFAYTMTDTTQGTPNWLNWIHQSCADYNGDGDIDIMVELQGIGGAGPRIKMYLYLGGPELFDTLWDWRSDSFEGLRSYGNVGDYNADGSADYLRAGTIQEFNCYNGGWPNMQSAPTWTFEVEDQLYTKRLGSGDINGDGWGDFTFQNLVYNVQNDTLVLDSAYAYFWLGGSEADSIPDITLGIDIPYAPLFPQWVGYWRIIGDVNGDGYDDMITWSLRDEDSGRQYIYPGGEPPDFETPIGFFDPPTAIVNHFRLHEFENLGDVNDDGFEDTGFYNEEASLGGGYLYIYLGGNPPNTQPVYGIVPDIDGFIVGLEMQPAGDFNDDGIDDWMFMGRDPGELRGRVIVVAGDERFGLPADETPAIHPASFVLHPCFPNPFNSLTTVTLSLPFAQQLDLSLFDITGRSVKSIAHSRFTAGDHAIQINAAGLPSGIYFVRAQSILHSATRKIVLLR